MNKQDRIKSNEVREQMFGTKQQAETALLGEVKLTKSEILKDEINGEISNSEDLQDTRK